MPRKAVSRTGPGGNRTDVGVPELQARPTGQPNGRPVQPVGVPTGLPYGQASQLAAAQQGAPLPENLPAAAGPPDFQSVLAAAKNGVPGVGQRPVTPLDDPTERPGEHVMTGAVAPYGLGPPVAPVNQMGPGTGAISDLLTQIAQSSGNPAISQLAQDAKALGQ